MTTLDEVTDFMAEKGIELELEGINSIPYWLMRMGLDEDEAILSGSEMVQSLVATASASGLSPYEAFMSCWLVGVTQGFIYANYDELKDE